MLACILWVPASSGFAVTYDYEVSFDEERVGAMVTKVSLERTANGAVRAIDNSLDIRVSVGSRIAFSLDYASSSQIGSSGLLRYESRATIDGEAASASASLERDALVVVVSLGGRRASKRFSQEDYDLTSAETVGFRPADFGSERTVRVLDLDEQEIVSRTLRWVADETLRIGPVALRCKVVEFEDRNARGIQWIGPDSHPVVVQEESEDEDGRFQLTLKSIR